MDADAEPTAVLAHVFLGSKAHARDRELLRRLEITHILNVTPPKTTDPVAGVPNFFEKDKSFTYRRCAIFDNKAEDILGVLEGCIAFMEQAKFYGRILVHCNKGVSRSPSVVIGYLMKTKDMSFEQALLFVADKRPMVSPNEGFRRQLEQYERRLRRPAANQAVKRAVRGPVGPALPPHLAPSPTETAEREDEAPPSIGPQLPPHLQKARPAEKEKENDEEDEQDDALERAKEHEEPTIGPSLPPQLQQKRASSRSSDGRDSPAPPKKKMKGAERE